MDRTDRQLLWVGHSFGRQKGIHSPAHGPIICCFGVSIFIYVRCPRAFFCFPLNQSEQFVLRRRNVSRAQDTRTPQKTVVIMAKTVTNFTTFPHILRRYPLQRGVPFRTLIRGRFSAVDTTVNETRWVLVSGSIMTSFGWMAETGGHWI